MWTSIDVLEAYQKVEARSAGFLRCREEAECLVSGLHLIRAAELANAFLEKDFHILRCGERETRHHVDGVLNSLRGVWVQPVAV